MNGTHTSYNIVSCTARKALYLANTDRCAVALAPQ